MSSATTTRPAPARATSWKRSGTSRSTKAKPPPAPLETLAQLLVRRHHADDSVNEAIGKPIRADLVVIDLCRYRDYADMVAALGLNAVRWLGFVALASVGVSA
jgi:hypothetical protein